jgi:SpoVK/Ycf46/Vps4 family AAA+-type ATPase
LVGVPGCGKSLTAKAIATAWGVPLLRLDLNALKSKFVGESEGNLRRALQTIEAIGRCVVWLDEIEKALSGATQGAADGGVSSDALGTVLNWMQERSGEAFVVATANDIEALPPELLRKGRFDEMFFVDCPNAMERESVLKAALSSNGRAAILDMIHGPTVAEATDGFTGAEIAALVPDALYLAFADGAREITTEDLIEAARSVVPLTKTASEKITRLRAWAASRCRPATDKPKALASVAPSLRAVEI